MGSISSTALHYIALHYTRLLAADSPGGTQTCRPRTLAFGTLIYLFAAVFRVPLRPGEMI